MSVVSIYVDGNTPLAAAARILRPITGASISDIQKALNSQEPVYRRELFLNEFCEVANDLRKIVSALKAQGIVFSITEFDDPITEDTLFNILEESEHYE